MESSERTKGPLAEPLEKPRACFFQHFPKTLEKILKNIVRYHITSTSPTKML